MTSGSGGFQRIPDFGKCQKRTEKSKLTRGFEPCFMTKKFKLNYAVDKRGRPISHSTTEDLKRFYDLSDSDSDLSDEESKVSDQKKVKGKKKTDQKGNKVKNID